MGTFVIRHRLQARLARDGVSSSSECSFVFRERVAGGWAYSGLIPIDWTSARSARQPLTVVLMASRRWARVRSRELPAMAGSASAFFNSLSLSIAGGVPAGAANAKYVGISVSAPPPASSVGTSGSGTKRGPIRRAPATGHP